MRIALRLFLDGYLLASCPVEIAQTIAVHKGLHRYFKSWSRSGVTLSYRRLALRNCV